MDIIKEIIIIIITMKLLMIIIIIIINNFIVPLYSVYIYYTYTTIYITLWYLFQGILRHPTSQNILIFKVISNAHFLI